MEWLELTGGEGGERENPSARAGADAGVQRMYGGTAGIMRELIGRTL